MLKRFCLYSFLKDLRFAEPFLLLALVEKGWTFAGIGVLLGLRDAIVAVLEVPTGIVADAIGYRKMLVVAFLCCILGYGVLGASTSWLLCGVGAIALGTGEACRTGLHKAMILTWLAHNGLGDAGTRYYGFTRSWGEIGAAVSVVLAAALVYATDTYQPLFYATLVPFVFNIVNISTYPCDVETTSQCTQRAGSFRTMVYYARRVFEPSICPILRQSIAFDAIFRSTKYYVQPTIELTTVFILAKLSVAPEEATPKSIALVAIPVVTV